MLNQILLFIILPFFISLFTTFFIIKILHKKLFQFVKIPEGPQKIHNDNTPRLGGVSIFTTLLVMSSIHYLFGEEEKDFLLLNLLILTPIFIFGLWEDMTQIVSPKLRLFGSLLSAILLLLIFDLTIKNIGIDLINVFLDNKYISFIFTSLCIVYLIQSFNIIDGLNGLSLFTAIISLISVSLIAFQLNDNYNFGLPFFYISILFGVLVFNFPFGKIFIGDSGAYLLGLLIALLVLLISKNNINLSPFIIVQVLIYPSYELLRSFCRRLISGSSIFKPDAKHLHSVLYKLNNLNYSYESKIINAISSSQIIFLQIVNSFYLLYFYNNIQMIIFGIISFILTYEIIYFWVNYRLKILKKNII